MASSSQRLAMLVVDDDDVDRERVRRFLGRSTLMVEITEAASGEEALARVRERPFDCVLLDNQLGDISGVALMPRLHDASAQGFPIVFITGAGDEALAVHVLREGAADYIAKVQLTAEALVRAIRRSVEQHRRLRDNAQAQRHLASAAREQFETLRKRERDMQTLIEHSPVAMGCWDAELRCRFGNPTLARWIGVAPRDLPSLPLERLFGQALSRALAPTLQRTLAGDDAIIETVLPPHGAEPERPVQVQLNPDRDDAGKVLGLFLTLNDIGAHRRAEARFEELLSFNEAVIEYSPIGIAAFGADGLCVLANAAFEALVGGPALARLRQEDLRGHAPWRTSGLVEVAAMTWRDGQPRRGEFTLERAAGEPLQWACALTRVDRGGEAHLLLIASDIGEQRRAQQALVQARDMAQAAARAKSAFLANVSHEIRTPLSAMVGLSRLALENGPGTSQQHMQGVYRSALALLHLLDDVLDYSKIEAGRLHVESLPFELPATLRQVIELYDVRAQQKGLSLELVCAPGLPQHVRGDPLRLSQVLNNLVGNAIKFTESGQVVLRVAGSGGPEDLLRFEVEDSGIGIAPERQPMLFRAFVQADESIARRFGGSGLGLAISAELVALMGGTIGVDSQAGGGSRFWFTAVLPALSAPPPGKGSGVKRDIPLAELARQVAPLAGSRVLVVDDDPVNQFITAEVLRQLGFEVDTAVNGLAAVRAVAAAPEPPYRLVLMDLQMPELDGIEATRQLRQLSGVAAPPVVGMTAATMPEDRARCLDAGMVDHVIKPVVPEQLVAVLLSWLRRPPDVRS